MGAAASSSVVTTVHDDSKLNLEAVKSLMGSAWDAQHEAAFTTAQDQDGFITQGQFAAAMVTAEDGGGGAQERSSGATKEKVGDGIKEEWRRQSSAAYEMLGCVKKADLTELKSMSKPPVQVKAVMDACLIALGDFNAPKQDTWLAAKKLLANTKFLQRLSDFDPDSITAATVRRLQPLMEDPANDPANTAKASKAVQGVNLWAHAVYGFGKSKGL